MRRLLVGALLSAALVPVLPAQAALTAGTWTTPSAGASVSGVVHLAFATQASTVTFKVPGQSLPATIADGTASADWDTTGTADGSQTISASECDPIVGCADVTEQVTIAEPAPLTSPAAGTAVAGGGTVSVSLAAPQSFSVTWRVLDATSAVVPGSSASAIGLTGTTTRTVATPARDQVWRQQALITPTCRTGTTCPAPLTFSWPITPVVAGPAAKVSVVSAPRTWHPVVDGLADQLVVKVRSDQAAALRLGLSRGKGMVTYGKTVTLTTAGVATLSSVKQVKPGTWRWVVQARNADGTVTTTKARTAVADARHLVSEVVTIDNAAEKVPHADFSGACSSATDKAGAVALESKSRCSRTKDSADVALAGFFPTLPAADAYGRIRITVTTTGGKAVSFVYEGGSMKVSSEHALTGGTTSFVVPGTVVSPKKHQLQFDIGTAGGEDVAIALITLDITVRRLQ